MNIRGPGGETHIFIGQLSALALCLSACVGAGGGKYPTGSVMQHTGLSGDRDGIAPWQWMRARLNATSTWGIDTEFRRYSGLSPGYDLGAARQRMAGSGYPVLGAADEIDRDGRKGSQPDGGDSGIPRDTACSAP